MLRFLTSGQGWNKELCITPADSEGKCQDVIGMKAAWREHLPRSETSTIGTLAGRPKNRLKTKAGGTFLNHNVETKEGSSSPEETKQLS